MAQLGNNTTFNRANQNGVLKGYHSRTVFSYSRQSPINLYNTNIVNESTTDGIQFLIDNSDPNDYHGSHIIPAYYWRPGKIFRVSGIVIANSSNDEGSGYLDMRFGLNAPLTWLAIQNDSQDHYFAALEPSGPWSVDFSCDICCAKIEPNTSNAEFNASGYYQYQWSSGDKDFRTVYVPVWSSLGTMDGLQDIYTGASTIMFNLFGSNIGFESGLYVTRLTIEELA